MKKFFHKKSESDMVPYFVKPMEKMPAKLFVYILVVFLLLVWFFPIYWLFATSLKFPVDAASMPPQFIFKPIMDNYREVFARGDFVMAYKNSTIISATAISLALLFGLPAAYGISRFRFPLRGLLSFWIVSTRFIPPVVVVIPFYLIFRTVGLLNTMEGMIIIHLVAALPVIIWIMYGFFKDVPYELEEAAAIDGASPMRIFTTIAVPLVAPGVVSAVIITLIASWNEFIYSMVLTSTNTKTLSVAIYGFISYENIEWTRMCAAGVLVILPILFFTILVQKYMVTGLTFGSVKS